MKECKKFDEPNFMVKRPAGCQLFDITTFVLDCLHDYIALVI